VPAAASASRPEAQARTLGLPRAARLRAARDFEACRTPQFRASSRWVGLAARSAEPDGDPAAAQVRIGVTAGKRMARKAVQRNLVKRILREAARHALPQLAGCAGARRVDVVLRLKDAFPTARELPLAAFRRALRADADAVLARLAQQLAARP
jgi:ribonuclease P protein component